jgi:hypothetical protein
MYFSRISTSSECHWNGGTGTVLVPVLVLVLVRLWPIQPSGVLVLVLYWNEVLDSVLESHQYYVVLVLSVVQYCASTSTTCKL